MDLKKIHSLLFYIPPLLFLAILAIPADSSAQIYYSEDNEIRVIPTGDTDSQLLIEADAYSIEVDAPGEYIYWSESAPFGFEIKRTLIDGSETTVINDESESVRGLSLDNENEKIYWVDLSNDGEILRADLNGDNPEVLIAGETDGVTDGILDITLNMENEHMYWVKLGAVMRADLDGSNIETFVEVESYIQPTSVDVNSRDEYVYWANQSNDDIMRADMNTGEAEVLINAESPAGISVDVENNMIFWLDDFFTQGNGQLNVANLDGSDVQVITETDFTRGAISASDWEIPTSSESVADQPRNIQLSQNYPNPFNPTTVIEYTLPATMEVLLTVYNSIGQEVAILANNRVQQSGRHQVSFDASGLTSGIYFYRLKTNQFTITRKMTLTK